MDITSYRNILECLNGACAPSVRHTDLPGHITAGKQQQQTITTTTTTNVMTTITTTTTNVTTTITTTTNVTTTTTTAKQMYIHWKKNCKIATNNDNVHEIEHSVMCYNSVYVILLYYRELMSGKASALLLISYYL